MGLCASKAKDVEIPKEEAKPAEAKEDVTAPEDVKVTEPAAAEPAAAEPAAAEPAAAPSAAEPATTGSSAYACDVLVVGGGFGGLACLGALRKAGYSAVLVCDGQVGEGQSLKCHGWLHRGTFPALLAPPLAKAWWEATAAFAPAGYEGNGADVCFSVPAPAFEGKLKPCLEDLGMPYEELATEGGITTIKSPDVVFDKPTWLAQMASGLEPFIGTGMACTGLACGADGAWEATCGSEVVRTKYVCVAAGTGNMAVLKGCSPELAAEAISPNQWIRPLTMFCVRGPKSLVGSTSTLVIRPPLPPAMLACNPGEETSVLYCTPFPGAPKPGESPESVMWDKYSSETWSSKSEWQAGMEPESSYATAVMKALFAERPDLLEALDQLEFGFYGGMKQDAGWQTKPMAMHLAEPAGSKNLAVGNCQFIGLCFAMADQLVGKVKEAIGEASEVEAPSWGLKGTAAAALGTVEETKASVEWLKFDDYKARYGIDM